MVVATERDAIGLATVIARKGHSIALREALRSHGIELAEGLRRSAGGDLAFIGTGPGTWLATHELGGDALKAALAPLAAMTAMADQSSAYVVLRVSGPEVREALAKLVPIDLHPRAFRVGDAASTVAAHIGVTVWRLEDDAGSAVFEIALYRSFAASFRHALSASIASAETG
jgi:methylglutamate dehydrogenase subunit D